MEMQNFDRWAKVYDLIYGTYDKDIDFYRKEARKSKGKVLEIACGTGRIYLELVKDGVDAYGIDISNKMLEILKKKAKELGLKPKVKKADMKSFSFNIKFSLIIIPFRSFLHNLTIEDQLKTLMNVRKHLKPKGKLILNFFYPNPEVFVKDMNKEIKEKIRVKDREYIKITKTSFADEVNQLLLVESKLKIKDKTYWRNKFKISFVYKREFELLLRLAGFKKWKVYGGFDYKSYKQEMVWIVER
ncbi:class I SAM-dependent methyltransferase [Candidatus Woesearchaeota archaeon]|nr:class I SAM-dependent methyltransferase [Candidatus Woesearchaeota archaeon]